MSAGFSRRKFVAGLGASLLAAPFVNLLSGPAQAATARAKRFVVFFSPNGTIHRFWRPTGTENDFTFAPGSILEPLAAHRSQLVVLDGLDFHGANNHDPGMAAMLTGGGGAGTATGGASVDQVIARHIGTGTKFASVELGVQTSAWGGSTSTRMSYAGAGKFVPPDDSPRNAFTRLFGDLAGGAEQMERLRLRRQSILDGLGDELADLHGRLGGEERVKLESHLASLREVEKGVQTPAGAGCQVPAEPARVGLYDNDVFPQVAKLQIDMAVQALACGLTRVASVQLSHTIGDRVYTWLGVGEGHHSLSHTDDGRADKIAEFVKVERWNAEQFGYLLTRLKQTPDPAGGNLLDGTVVLWAKELGDGRMHTCESVPWVLAGGGGTAWRTGRYLRLGGAKHTRVLVSLCHAFGLELQTFGDPASGSGPLGVL
jgi:hypothetical protein